MPRGMLIGTRLPTMWPRQWQARAWSRTIMPPTGWSSASSTMPCPTCHRRISPPSWPSGDAHPHRRCQN
eukprot:6424946-Lingulodinium_polyedra.AAC.1